MSMPITGNMPANKDQTFVVVAPAYSSRSGGIMVLHQLCTELNRAGYKTGLVLITEGSQANQGYKFGYSNSPELLEPAGICHDFFTNRSASEIQEFIRNSVAVYPDIIKGNPLDSKAFCTYVLGVPKFKIESQYIIRYSKLYIEDSDFTLHKPFIDSSMNDHGTRHWTQRDLCLTYIGKGREFLECHTLPGTVLFERDWPRTKQELALLLKNCKYLFTWDCISATNSDAVLCGAVPIMMHDLQLPRTTLNTCEYGALPILDDPLRILTKCSDEEERQFDQMLTDFKSKMHTYHRSWHQNVIEFSDDVTSKFK